MIRFALSSVVIALISVNAVRSAERPNILYIMSDDHAAHAISAYGSRLAKIAPTPNIDRLAKEGALFSNAFCTNSICSPSRACVLTGQYNHTNGAFDLGGKVEPGKLCIRCDSHIAFATGNLFEMLDRGFRITFRCSNSSQG